jgi:hypothetical protein
MCNVYRCARSASPLSQKCEWINELERYKNNRDSVVMSDGMEDGERKDSRREGGQQKKS